MNACGIDDFHDGVNYTRTACVIAVSARCCLPTLVPAARPSAACLCDCNRSLDRCRGGKVVYWRQATELWPAMVATICARSTAAMPQLQSWRLHTLVPADPHCFCRSPRPGTCLSPSCTSWGTGWRMCSVACCPSPCTCCRRTASSSTATTCSSSGWGPPTTRSSTNLKRAAGGCMHVCVCVCGPLNFRQTA